ncbi:MAG: phosphonoacetaldehyde hydrolase [Acidimicrobiia bacterium]|nr:phosphonoacetaldehyde hydrolase [Actinomycetota bacterium]MBL6923919.1 phosphonoacetaldehyde hydrolase [Acidimicrobiia bacterium]
MRPGGRATGTYRGRLRGVVLDWSGTTVDAYVIAPAIVFVEVFHKQGVQISMAEARGPMGLRKDLHIEALAHMPDIRERWHEVHGRYPDQSDVDAMFADFVPMQVECLPRYATLLPGVAELAERLRSEHDIRIGVSTGFTRPMVEVLLEHAAEQGFIPDCAVAGDDVDHGARPRPFMVYRNMELLDVHPIQSVVKVDDTGSGVGEGVEAGCWAVGIARYSNYLNINSMEEAESISDTELAERLMFTRNQLWSSGAHYVIDEPLELLAVIEDINARMAAGEAP